MIIHSELPCPDVEKQGEDNLIFHITWLTLRSCLFSERWKQFKCHRKWWEQAGGNGGTSRSGDWKQWSRVIYMWAMVSRSHQNNPTLHQKLPPDAFLGGLQRILSPTQACSLTSLREILHPWHCFWQSMAVPQPPYLEPKPCLGFLRVTPKHTVFNQTPQGQGEHISIQSKGIYHQGQDGCLLTHTDRKNVVWKATVENQTQLPRLPCSQEIYVGK